MPYNQRKSILIFMFPLKIRHYLTFEDPNSSPCPCLFLVVGVDGVVSQSEFFGNSNSSTKRRWCSSPIFMPPSSAISLPFCDLWLIVV